VTHSFPRASGATTDPPVISSASGARKHPPVITKVGGVTTNPSVITYNQWLPLPKGEWCNNKAIGYKVTVGKH